MRGREREGPQGSLGTPWRARASSCQEMGTTWFFSSCGGILELRWGSQPSSWVGPGKANLRLELRGKAGGCARVPMRETQETQVQSLGFSRQEHWSGLPFPSQGIFPTQGSNPGIPLQADSLPAEPPGNGYSHQSQSF